MVNVLLTGVLTTNAGAPIVNETVNFGYKLPTDSNFTSAGSALTNTSGIAQVTVTGLLASTTYDFTDAFAGDTNINVSGSTSTIAFDTSGNGLATVVTIAAPTLTMTGYTFEAEIQGTLTVSTTGAPVPAETLSVLVDGTQVGTTAATGSLGTFSFLIQNLALGSHQVAVDFAGDTTYLPSQGSTTVSMGGSPPVGSKTLIIGVGAAAVLGIIGLVVFG